MDDSLSRRYHLLKRSYFRHLAGGPSALRIGIRCLIEPDYWNNPRVGSVDDGAKPTNLRTWWHRRSLDGLPTWVETGRTQTNDPALPSEQITQCIVLI